MVAIQCMSDSGRLAERPSTVGSEAVAGCCYEPAAPFEEEPMDDAMKIDKALEIGFRYGGIDGAHHKQWVIDQMLRALAGEHYDDMVEDMNTEDGDPNAYQWDVGISP